MNLVEMIDDDRRMERISMIDEGEALNDEVAMKRTSHTVPSFFCNQPNHGCSTKYFWSIPIVSTW
jgi:hypothetical protein